MQKYDICFKLVLGGMSFLIEAESEKEDLVTAMEKAIQEIKPLSNEEIVKTYFYLLILKWLS